MSSAAFIDNQSGFSSLQFGARACAAADVADQSGFHWHKASGERGGDGGVACSDVADQSRFHWHKASGERGGDGGVPCSAVADQSPFHWHKASGGRGRDGGVACSAVADQSRFHWHKASGERGHGPVKFLGPPIPPLLPPFRSLAQPSPPPALRRWSADWSATSPAPNPNPATTGLVPVEP